jgi:hypothetical protein
VTAQGLLYVFTTYPSADASRRLRIDPAVEQLRATGAKVRLHSLLTPWMFQRKNRPALRLIVGALLALRLMQRLALVCALSECDLVLIHREAFPFFTPAVERMVVRRAGNTVLDVDDALYAEPTHRKDWRRWLRNPARYEEVLESVGLVIAGSPTLEAKSAAVGTKAILGYTVPPRRVFDIRPEPAQGPTFFWTGSHSTLGSLHAVLDGVLDVCGEIGGRLVVLGGDNIASLPRHPCLHAARWSEDREIEYLKESWVGLMPLPANDWEAGKSGYKALLYLAAGLRVVASAVGINAIFRGAPGVTLVDDVADWPMALRTAAKEPPDGGNGDSERWLADELGITAGLSVAARALAELRSAPMVDRSRP